jgi:hypothetical protein
VVEEEEEEEADTDTDDIANDEVRETDAIANEEQIDTTLGGLQLGPHTVTSIGLIEYYASPVICV